MVAAALLAAQLAAPRAVRALVHTPMVSLTAGGGGARRGAAAVRAAAAGQERASAADSLAAELPESREQAIQQALQAVQAQLAGKPGKKRKQGFARVGLKKLSLEVPVADDSAGGQVSLGLDVASGLRELLPLGEELLLVYADEDAADAAQAAAGANDGAVAEPLFLGDCFDAELDGTLVVVAPRVEQAEQVESLVRGWRGSAAVLLNPEWGPAGGVPAAQRAFVRSFDTVYAFMPLAVQGLMSAREGAVFRWVRRGGAPTAQHWQIFMRQGDEWQQVGRMASRPSPSDLELAMYNASAAASPITAGAKLLRKLADKVSPPKQ